MGIQINPVAVALLIAALVAGFFLFYDFPSTEATVTEEEENEYAGKPLPTIFYKNHTAPENTRQARSVPEEDTIEPQIVALPINITSELTPSRSLDSPRPRPISSTNSRRSSGRGGSSSDSNDAPAFVPAVTNNTLNSTNSTNNTTPVNLTNSTPVNQTIVNSTTPTNTTPVNNTPIIPPVNITNSTPPKPPLNTTNSTPPAPKAELSIESGFPQDQNVAFRCRAEGATKYDWDFGHGKDEKNDDGTVFHTFPGSGTYTVTCTAKGNGQESKVSKLVTVSTPKEVSADYPYAAVMSKTGQGDTYTFTCEDIGYTATGFHWKFSGGQYTSTVAGVNSFDDGSKTMTHTFPGAGTYSVSCEAISYDERMSKAYWEEGSVCNSARGCIIATAADSVTVEGQPEPPAANETDEEEDVDDEPIIVTSGGNETNATNSTA